MEELEIWKKIVPPHKIIARLVTEKDIERVIEDTKVMYEICLTGAYAMHHSQINESDPLSFFVTSNRKIIINPQITNQTKVMIDGLEGCLTFMKPWINIPRSNKIEVEYVTIMTDPNDSTKFKFSSIIKEDFSGMEARIFQHEFDHGESKYIYDD